jgi:hypothetical protein
LTFWGQSATIKIITNFRTVRIRAVRILSFLERMWEFQALMAQSAIPVKGWFLDESSDF